MSKTNNFRKRILALFLALTMCLSLVQVTAFAVEEESAGTDDRSDPSTSVEEGNIIEDDGITEDSSATEGDDTTEDSNTAESNDTTEDSNTTEGDGTTEDSNTAEGDGTTEDSNATEGDDTTEDSNATEGDGTTVDSNATEGSDQEPVCTCESKCSGDSVNQECVFCSADDADLTNCLGREPTAEISTEVQAFLDAVNALPAEEELPAKATAEEIAALQALVDACQEAYDVLSEADKALEDVVAAVSQMKVVSEKIQAIEQETEEKINWDGDTATLTINDVESLDQDAALAYVKELGTNAASVKVLVLKNVQNVAPYAFHKSHWKALETVTIADTATIGDHAFMGLPCLTGVSLENVGTLQSNAFSENKALTSLSLNSIEFVGAEAFRQCSALTSDGLDMTNVNAFDRSPFSYCTSLTELKLDGESAGLGSLGATMFYGCTGLTEVELKNFNTISTQMFNGCTSLETVTLESIDTIGQQVFHGCTSLENVILKDIKTIGEQAFLSCAALKTVTMDNIGTIGKNAFASCKSLETVEIGTADTIGQYAFYNCTGLQNVTMGSVGTIDQYAFWGCESLKNVDSLENVKDRIGGFAFYGCKNLTGLTAEALTKMGYNGSVEMMERMKAILAGTFRLDSAEEIVELSPDASGWDGSGVGKSGNWDKYDNGTQLVEQVRWIDTTNSVEAEVQVDAYYTAEQQMDYIFVADLSASMAQLGNSDDSNARFYDMQSKLLDMTGQLLGSAGYDCRVAIVTFGGLFKDTQTVKTMGFTSDTSAAEGHILSLEPLNENTDYGLGLQEAAKLVSSNSGRNMVVVFLSDGAPNASGSGDMDGTKAAAQIKGSGVPIYGVLHSPTAAQRDKALARMKAVCGENTVYESTDTESFGLVMNKAFASAYPTNTVTIPVSEDFTNVRGLEVSTSAGEASYDSTSHTITWTVTGMPFTKHTLSYRMTLTEENAQKTGPQSFTVNNGKVTFGCEAGAYAELDLDLVKLDRTLWTVTYTDGVDGEEIFADQTSNVLNGRTAPSFKGTPSRQGYEFIGWWLNGAIYDLSTPVTGNITLTAAWALSTHDHTWGVWNVTREATCGSDGLRVRSCTVPGCDATDSEVIPATGEHTWGAWVVTTPATTTAPGVETRTCTVCQRAETRPIAQLPAPVIPTPTPTPIPDNPTPRDPGTTITDNEVPLANVTGLNDTEHFAYITGYPDGTVRPMNNITRAEVATIFFRLMTEEYRVANWSTSNSFTDAEAGAWYSTAISTAAAAGILKGYADGSVKPNAPITRAEFAAIAARFVSNDVTDDGTGDFSDTAGHWAAKEIRLAVKAGWVKGDGNSFRPNDPINRAEVMVLVNRMLDRTADADNMLPGMKTWSDNPAGTWYYAAVQEATIDHGHERGEDGVTELWTELTEAKDWTALLAEWTANNGASASDAGTGTEAETQDPSEGN